jgi:hypothetical protein
MMPYAITLGMTTAAADKPPTRSPINHSRRYANSHAATGALTVNSGAAYANATALGGYCRAIATRKRSSWLM